MNEILIFVRILWGVIFFLNAELIALLIYRRNHRAFPFFFVYVVFNFLQGITLFESYRIWGFRASEAFWIAWGSQGLVSTTRALAVAEICRRILRRYSGIWQLAWRALLTAAIATTAYSLALAKQSWQLTILNLDRSLELLIASVIVLLFLFARYYGVEVESAIRTIGVGFFLYSSFRVLNITILERLLHRYAILWNLLEAVTFLAVLLLWSWALRKAQPATSLAPELSSEVYYRVIMPEINVRLRVLNESLARIWSRKWKER
ncbi:MAG TPA: hypothetical protein VJN92_13150 [Candidatus Acidoferrum sp.]|nr:hypothetical protein [Candidatus Acidoferrum sp.]